jgi:hypothetical protein
MWITAEDRKEDRKEGSKKKGESIENLSSYISEAIDYILISGRDLDFVMELVNAVDSGDKQEIKRALLAIEDNRSTIFDDGLYHLPNRPLQDVVEEFISEAEGMIEEEEEEEEEE